jgi:chromosome segregation ATPase
MRLNSIEINGFKSFAKKASLEFENPIVSVVGPNGSGKSNVVEAIRFVLGEQSMKSMRGKAGLDLIFKGSKTLSKGSRATVSIYFNNKDKIFKLENNDGENINLNYDTISISREVYPDGINKYILNGSEVRLKDINNLLASVNIGSSGHHIISQGEADRILNASPRDRKEMVEDALGLKIYQYKIREAERKLERTGNNMKEVSLLRRENAPHLNFLKKQVEKFEKATEMKVTLLDLYREYLKKESIYLENEKNTLASEKDKISNELETVVQKIKDTEVVASNVDHEKETRLADLEKKIYEIRSVKSELERKLGRIEGMIEMEERRSIPPMQAREANKDEVSIPKEELEAFLRETNEYLEEAMYIDVLENVAPILGRIKDILNRFARLASHADSKQNHTPEDGQNNTPKNVADISDLKNTEQQIATQIKEIESEENKIRTELSQIRQAIEKAKEAGRDQERENFSLKVKHQELSSHLEMVTLRENNLNREKEIFENEIKEGGALIGADILSYKDYVIEDITDRSTQEDMRKKIERIKIKLEDAGLGGGGEILKEYEETRDRDAFLAKEMEDLAGSIESLKKLMDELKAKIDIEFKEGIKKINKEFQEFFALMFGGGTGHLDVIVENKRRKATEEEETEEVEDETPPEEGIDISVSLPHKKVKELHALSGGERSLTSIALLFAMSQVNPPPFLVLDETDAALDESNSRKFGDMLERLSKRSQLIVVTHNRETMSRAGALYGVTVGSDGASKLLSVKFEEATVIAK